MELPPGWAPQAGCCCCCSHLLGLLLLLLLLLLPGRAPFSFSPPLRWGRLAPWLRRSPQPLSLLSQGLDRRRLGLRPLWGRRHTLAERRRRNAACLRLLCGQGRCRGGASRRLLGPREELLLHPVRSAAFLCCVRAQLVCTRCAGYLCELTNSLTHSLPGQHMNRLQNEQTN